MKKGCIIALVVVAALVAIGVGLFVVFGLPKLKGIGSASFIVLTETAAESYTEEYGSPPEGDQAKVLGALRGNNPKEIVFLGNELDGQISDGKLLDAWRNPMKMSREDGAIRFTSPGPDGQHGTDDDVTSAGIRDLVGKIEEKAAEAEAKAEAKAKATE